MKLFKRRMALAIGLTAVLALAISSSASAAAFGGAPAPGNEIAIESIGPVEIETGVGYVSCAHWTMESELLKNTKVSKEGKVVGVFSSDGIGAGTVAGCYHPSPFWEVEIDNLNLVSFSSDEYESGTAWMSFEMDLGGFWATYLGQEIPFHINVGSNTIEFKKALIEYKSGAGFGNLRLSGSFAVSLTERSEPTRFIF